MDVALVVFTDGRQECLDKTVPIALARLKGSISEKYLIDDSGWDPYAKGIGGSSLFADFNRFHHLERVGFCRSVQQWWVLMRTVVAAPYVFHLEDDFLIKHDIDLDAATEILEADPYLWQVAFKRGPVNVEERLAGGVMQQHPGEYLEEHVAGHTVMTHTRFFTTNPSVYPTTIAGCMWPGPPACEGAYSRKLLADWPGSRFAYYGPYDGPEYADHISAGRVGNGY